MLYNETPAREVTPFEQAQLNIDDMCAGFALCQMLQELIEKLEECELGAADDTLPVEVRFEAERELKEVTAKLQIVAAMNEVHGISC